MAKISGKILREIFENSIKNSGTYKCLDYGMKNPAHIIFNGVEMYVYIKNLSPAYFGNPDVWRAQMTGLDILSEIKESSAMFILLGYDSTNNVYGTWNPHQVKQRIGTASSPSLYSRFSLQQEAARSGEIKSMVLNNDLEVLVFPESRLVDVLSNLDKFFPNTSDYVALGSKRRSDANAAYKELTKSKRLDDFVKYLFSLGYKDYEVERYCQTLRIIFKSNIISLHRKIFLAYDSLEDYPEAVKEFFKLSDVLDSIGRDNIYPSVLLRYIEFLNKQQGYISGSETLQGEIGCCDEDNGNTIIENNIEDKNWESAYEDEEGNLTRLANPELLKLLRPYLDTDYPSLPPAYNIISDFYGNRYPKMQLKDWGKLFNSIKWDSCDKEGFLNDYSEKNSRKKKSHILRVEMPDGNVIEDRNVSTTYCKFIEYVGAEEINILGILHAGVNIVSKELDSKYASYQREISGGWYVMTNSSTSLKYQDIQDIIREYNLNIKVSLVPFETSIANAVSLSNSQKGIRQKIRVFFPDGRIIQPTRVYETLVEVVKYAGAERVRSLNIIICGGNMISKQPIDPMYESACKDVGDGWLCNTCSDTPKKYELIKNISERLQLGIKVELLSPHKIDKYPQMDGEQLSMAAEDV